MINTTHHKKIKKLIVYNQNINSRAFLVYQTEYFMRVCSSNLLQMNHLLNIILYYICETLV